MGAAAVWRDGGRQRSGEGGIREKDRQGGVPPVGASFLEGEDDAEAERNHGRQIALRLLISSRDTLGFQASLPHLPPPLLSPPSTTRPPLTR